MHPVDTGPMPYAYVLRTRPDNIPQHEDTYNRNAQAWHYTNARINELIQEVERILEVQDRQVSEESQFGPPPQRFIDTPCTFHLGTIPNWRYSGERTRI